MQTLTIFFSKLLNKILRYCIQINSPWICVIKICSNGGATYIICEVIAKDNLNIANEKFSSPKLLNRILRYCTQIVLDYV